MTSCDSPAPHRLRLAVEKGPDRPVILLIDDDAAVAAGLGQLLERHGYAVVLAGNGLHGLRWLETRCCDLVITDIYMDGMDGLETLIQLRRRFPFLPVVAISGGSPKMPIDCLKMARSLGANVVLDKPVQIADLLAAMCRAGLPQGTAGRGTEVQAFSATALPVPAGDHPGPCF